MSLPWHRENPGLFSLEKSEVEAAFPNLHFVINDDIVLVRGTFPIVFDDQSLDHYLIEVELRRDHPKGIPIVRETGGRIPRVSGRHMNPTDGTACVLLTDERWWVWPPGSRLLSFLKGPVHNFFLGQSLVELGEPWPFGQWGHGADGIREFYAERLGTDDIYGLMAYVEYLAKKKIKGHWPCPCQSGKRLRECHGRTVHDLAEKIPRQVAMESLKKLREQFKLL
ncbi:MAG: SEC-C domain-containing protein [Desulfobacteraceae bacterium]|nr:MAG: SEC-C domain-containing protein [Desulfobacteraceae bacterium]